MDMASTLALQSLGFLLAGIGLVGMFCWKSKKVALAVAPPVFSGSMAFIGMMVAGLGAICTCLSMRQSNFSNNR